MSDKSKPTLANIRIDGCSHVVDPSRNLLEVALELGYDLPYFCWHPELGSVGACRQCAVTQYADDKDDQGRVVMACMTPCNDGLRSSISDAQAVEMRSAVIEMLMTNHPHDCPVCEEGGNCHLQDMTVMAGHAYREYRHSKRSHRNQDLGPFIGHEMNRCIACYRCVRYYRDYAGGDDLNVFGAHNNVYFGRAEDGVLDNEFSGNLVEVCPTGVFTDKPYGASFTRKWDLQQAPSVCAHCSIGCNVLPGERYGLIKRIENRYHGELNGYFLCDRGRFGYGYTNAQERPRQAHWRNGSLREIDADEGLRLLATALREGDLIGIGSPRASVEANYALRKLVGKDSFFRGESAAASALHDAGVALLQNPAVQIANIRRIETADAALVLGEDVLNTGARVALALRQMTRQRGLAMAQTAHVPAWQEQSVSLVAQQARSPLFMATPAATQLDDIAQSSYRATPAGIARLGYAVAHALNAEVKAPARFPEHSKRLADQIAAALSAAERPLLVTGAGCADIRVLEAATAIATAFFKATNRQLPVAVVFPECNSVGASLLGGRALDELAELSGARTAIVVENDLSRRLSAEALQQLASTVEQLIVIDSQHTPTSKLASLQLPAGTVFEADGTLVNFEGRAQRTYQTAPAADDIHESWRWLQAAAHSAGLDKAPDLGDGLDALTTACAKDIPALAKIVEAAPSSSFRMSGRQVPRQSHRASGRTAMTADQDVHELRPILDRDSPLSYSMEGAVTTKDKPAALIPMFWSPGWNSPQAVNKFQEEIGGALRGGDPGSLLLSPVAARSRSAKPPAAPNRLVAVPLHHLFGSEELSARAPAIQERANLTDYVGLHPETAAKAKLANGDAVRVKFKGCEYVAPLTLRTDLDKRSVGIPAGLPATAALPLGGPVTLEALP